MCDLKRYKFSKTCFWFFFYKYQNLTTDVLRCGVLKLCIFLFVEVLQEIRR